MLLATPQLEGFVANTAAPRDRLVLLPPTLDPRRAAPLGPAERAAERTRLGLGAHEFAWLWVGLQPRTKGLDRALTGLAATPGARLLVCGPDPAGAAAAESRRLADRLGVAGRVTWLGFLRAAATPAAMAAADVLVHPARADVTGMVILEAMANGVPVITTAVCGFGEHVLAAGAGVVLPEPFRADDLAAAAVAAPPKLAGWSAAARAYTANDALFSGLGVAADVILSAPYCPAAAASAG
jgi:UDP-glucose:(heptosyl)LPS alpha-1,3-glucosyltransferase